MSDGSDEGTGIFDGILFWVEKPIAGHTVSKIQRLISENGGRVAKKLEEMPTHFILSPQLWAREGGPGPSVLIKGIKKANEANATDKDPDHERAWMLQPEWLLDSVDKKTMLSEYEYDYQKLQETARAHSKKAIDLERKRNGGKSKFGRGERRRLALEQQRAKAVAEVQKEMAKEEEERKKEAEKVFGTAGGLAAPAEGQTASGSSAPRPAPQPAKPQMTPDEIRKRAAEAAMKRQNSQTSKDQGDEPDIYDQMSRKVKGNPKPAPKPASSSSAPKPKASDVLKPGRVMQTHKRSAPGGNSSDEEPLIVKKKRKT